MDMKYMDMTIAQLYGHEVATTLLNIATVS